MPKFRYPNGPRTVRLAVTITLVVCLVGASAIAAGEFAATAPPGDAADRPTEAEYVDADETVEANLSSGEDVDWYAVNVTAGEGVIAELYLLNNSGGRSVSVELYGPDREPIYEQKREKMNLAYIAGEGLLGTQDAHAVAPNVAEANTTYYVKVAETQWNETAENVTSPYNLTVTTRSLDRYDPNENGSTATVIGLGQTVEGVSAAYDHDVYAVDLVEGYNYTVTFDLTNPPSRAHYSKEIRLFTDEDNVTDRTNPGSEAGTILMRSHKSGGSVTFTAPENGTHYLRIGQSSVNDELLTLDAYRLTVSSVDGGSEPSDASDGPGREGSSSDGSSSDGSGSDGASDAETPADSNEPGSGTNEPTPTRTPTTTSSPTPSASRPGAEGDAEEGGAASEGETRDTDVRETEESGTEENDGQDRSTDAGGLEEPTSFDVENGEPEGDSQSQRTAEDGEETDASVTPTDGSTGSATTADTSGRSTDGSTGDEETPTSGGGPGFGIVAVFTALVTLGLVARRRVS